MCCNSIRYIIGEIGSGRPRLGLMASWLLKRWLQELMSLNNAVAT